jgi:hypothetical protein
MMNPPPPMRLPPEPGEPRDRLETDDVPINEAAIAETGGWCYLWAALAALFPSAAAVVFGVLLALRL